METASAQWLPLSAPVKEWQPTDEELEFVGEARALLETLRPLRASGTWAMIYSSLVLVVPLDRRPGPALHERDTLHTGLQLMMGFRDDRKVILGAWHDAHYAWDYDPKPLDFRIEGHGPESRAMALEWLEKEMRRPILRFDGQLLGWTIFSEWRHAAEAGRALEWRGFWPLALIVNHKRSRGLPAGYLDPW
jgi:hypothetical protein